MGVVSRNSSTVILSMEKMMAVNMITGLHFQDAIFFRKLAPLPIIHPTGYTDWLTTRQIFFFTKNWGKVLKIQEFNFLSQSDLYNIAGSALAVNFNSPNLETKVFSITTGQEFLKTLTSKFQSLQSTQVKSFN